MELYILKQLEKYSKKNKCFHMPGHKGNKNFSKRFTVAPLDITELSYSDNLASPTGVIARAQEDIAKLLGADKSYILTDGSTSGVMAMMYAASKHGKKVIVPRNSHQSVWNACALLGLEPIILQGETVDGVLLPPRPSEVERYIRGDETVAGMIAVSPDYYGNIAPLSEYADILSKYSRVFMVDEAHGAHVAFEWDKTRCACTYADMWVDGAHKTFSTLTQGAVVSAKAAYARELEEGLSIFRTTSPSYPIMASVEYGVKIAAEPVPRHYGLEAREMFEKRFPQFKVYPSGDWTKLLIDFSPLSISADKVYAELEKRGIYAEFSDGRYVLFYLSRETSTIELMALGNVLKKIVKRKKIKNTYVPRPEITFPSRISGFQYALKSRKELIDIRESEGRICARNAGISPPCIPLVAAGEIITEQVINALSSAAHTFGLEDGKITVVKK